MATLEQNIAAIRSTAIYGTDMREAIASAIEQSDTKIANRITSIQQTIETDSAYMEAKKITGTENDYMLEITNHR